MVTGFYFVVFILSLIMTTSFLLRNKNVDSLFLLFSLLVTINCMGRFLLSVSPNIEMAIWSNKFLYVGAVYAPLLMIVVLARLCNTKIPKPLFYIMTTYSTIVLAFVMTIGYSGIYYKSCRLIHADGYNYLEKVYGPLHILYPVMMISYAVMVIVYLTLAIKKRNQISFKTVVAICFTGFSVILLYTLERIIKFNFDVLVFGYLLGIVFMFRYFEELNMYDMSVNIVNSIDKLKEYGYIVLDDKFHYINSNKYIRELFPEIKEWIVDKEIPVSDSYLYQEVVEFVKSNKNNAKKAEKIISVYDLYFQVTIREITYKSKGKVGYLVEFADRTLERKYYHTIEKYNARLEKEVEEKTRNIVHIKDMMVLGMADMVESRDNSTGGHIKRTSAVVQVFSDKLDKYNDKFHLSHDFLQKVKKAAPMHDLGKIAIYDDILKKPGKYTDAEYAEMKRHAAEGAKIVENILKGVEDDDFVVIAKNVAHYHHEKWNGKGYPTGISGTDIPVEARIMALADVFDALVSKRCYKEAFTYEEAFKIIEDSLGEHFDPELGKVFLTCRPELEKLYDSYK